MSFHIKNWLQTAWIALIWMLPGNASPTLDEGVPHWAFSPVMAPPVPAVADARSPIDAFVLAELRSRQISPAAPADPRDLLRRLSFDLTGLPPSFEQTEALARAAENPERYTVAVASAVDQFLVSSAFGEKWARHWLDVARYSDTKGYVFQEERRYPFAYGYRDWVIRAFNADMPYDRFLVAQLAADLVDKGPASDLAAMGYLTLGRRFLNREPDIIDDRIDVVTRGMLGLTVACARCHDHKFDPVPIDDYYSLYGVFQSSTEPGELPMVGEPDDREAYAKFQTRLAKLEQSVVDYKQTRHAELLAPESVEAYLVATSESLELEGRALRRFAQDRKLYPAALRRWQELVKQEDDKHSVFGVWRKLCALDADADASSLADLITEATGGKGMVWDYFQASPITSVSSIQGAIAEFLTSIEGDPERAILSSEQGIAGLSPEELVRDYKVGHRNEVRKLQRAVDKFRATDDGAPTRAMVLVDRKDPVEPVIFERGNPSRRGAKVPRQFLSVLARGDRQPFTHGSGRLELAEAIADPENPLTARVMVNRIWMHLMGAPLVDSPSDFGVRTAQPQIPGLLDHLAADFVKNGWSMKQLIRSIVLSQTYQQSTITEPSVAEQDPDNRLYARATRKRLPFESLRDAMLVVSGKLNPKMYGRAVDLESKQSANRKTIYGFVDRQNLPGVFRTFDFAGPDAHCAQRHETTVPQQALFLMNNPFTQEMAAGLAQLPEVAAAGEAIADRISQMYRAALSRNPTAREATLGNHFVESCRANGQDPDAVWSAYAQALLASNEFAFCD